MIVVKVELLAPDVFCDALGRVMHLRLWYTRSSKKTIV